jgi:prolyl oligopeptidase
MTRRPPRARFLAIIAIAFMSGCASVPDAPFAQPRPVTDTYFGTTVTDPYRYFENVKEDPQVQAWFKGQAEHARAVLDSIPGRQALLDQLLELSNAVTARVTDVSAVPGRVFYEQRKSGENQFKLYARDGWNAPERLLFDPDVLQGKDGPPAAINYFSPSPNGRYVVVGVSPGGSEDATIRVIDGGTGADTGLAIVRGRYGGIAWRDDESGFYYNQLKERPADAPPTLLYQDSQVRFHHLGDDPAQDPVVFGTAVPGGVPITPEQTPYVATDYGSPYAYAIVQDGVRNEVALYVESLKALDAGKAAWQKVFDFDDLITDFTVHGADLYVLTHKDAPRFKLLHTKVRAPDLARAEVLIPPGAAVLKTSYAARDALYVERLDGGINRLQRIAYTPGARPQEIELPLQGTIGDVVVNSRLDGVQMYLTSWTNAGGYYSFDPATGKIADTMLQPHGPYDQPTDLVAEEVRVPSHDGVMVPLSIVYKKGLKLDGSNPCWLEAYGAYGMVDDAGFGPAMLAWYERGGIYALAHVRGGGAFGEEWHLAGQKLTKPNTWKDLMAAGEWLCAKGYTSPLRLGIIGGSAGGITVGRAMTERPDLFRAVVGEVGVFNPVRSETDPNGVPNIPEFGTVKDPQEFRGLLAMDAYQHVRGGVRYPATLLTTGMNDPRVPPWEPGKFAARLQQVGAPLVLLRVDYEAGHGIGSTRAQALEELADTMAFFLWQFGVPGFQPR